MVRCPRRMSAGRSRYQAGGTPQVRQPACAWHGPGGATGPPRGTRYDLRLRQVQASAGAERRAFRGSTRPRRTRRLWRARPTASARRAARLRTHRSRHWPAPTTLSVYLSAGSRPAHPPGTTSAPWPSATRDGGTQRDGSHPPVFTPIASGASHYRSPPDHGLHLHPALDHPHKSRSSWARIPRVTQRNALTHGQKKTATPRTTRPTNATHAAMRSHRTHAGIESPLCRIYSPSHSRSRCGSMQIVFERWRDPVGWQGLAFVFDAGGRSPRGCGESGTARRRGMSRGAVPPRFRPGWSRSSRRYEGRGIHSCRRTGEGRAQRCNGQAPGQ
jgi:hypothetical protein